MPLFRTLRLLIGLLAAVAPLLSAPANLRAQLRPLEPLDWAVFDNARTLSVELGAGVHYGQRASLAGIEGRLLELGTFRLAWSTGRVVLLASGTAQRVFDRRSAFAAPDPGVTESGERRHDSGDYRVATAVRLTPADRGALLALRFGARLPTTDNRIGLDRDQTDFFALLGAQLQRSRFRFGAEAGVGIHGTREPDYEQSDVLLYAFSAEYLGAHLTPRLVLLGQNDGGRQPVVRGNEDLSELRVGARFGRRVWLDAAALVGLTTFSPTRGLLLSAGFAR